jgi:tetratricopeptide (TPR) repeat protein
MASRLLARLDAAIAKTRDPVQNACLRAERAGFLARQGRLDEAQRTIDDLHARFSLRPHAQVSAWVALVEGLRDHFSSLAPSARDRLQRAYALSGAAHLAPLHALAAAWLAHMDFVQHEMTQMANHVAEALRTAAPDHHSARSRACLVAAYAYHFAGRLDRAKPWYDRARQHALADGDEAALGALLYNRATMQGNNARLAAAFGTADRMEYADLAREALMGAESSTSFDIGTANDSLAYLSPTLQAQVLASNGEAAKALALYERWLDVASTDGLRRLRPCFLADMASCRLQLGHPDEARADVASALDSLNSGACETDDRAVANARLAQVLDALGDAARAAVLRDRAQRDLAMHRAEQARLAALLDDALAGL